MVSFGQLQTFFFFVFIDLYSSNWGVSCMTPLFKLFLMCSVTLLAAINVADAFILAQMPEAVELAAQ
ncbi:MAG: hypothetical protein D9N14_12545 [Ketobacter sp.]|nr:MAG: hypothetical protein D9N14_12545 [Ketobacter sp.]